MTEKIHSLAQIISEYNFTDPNIPDVITAGAKLAYAIRCEIILDNFKDCNVAEDLGIDIEDPPPLPQDINKYLAPENCTEFEYLEGFIKNIKNLHIYSCSEVMQQEVQLLEAKHDAAKELFKAISSGKSYFDALDKYENAHLAINSKGLSILNDIPDGINAYLAKDSTFANLKTVAKNLQSQCTKYNLTRSESAANILTKTLLDLHAEHKLPPGVTGVFDGIGEVSRFKHEKSIESQDLANRIVKQPSLFKRILEQICQLFGIHSKRQKLHKKINSIGINLSQSI